MKEQKSFENKLNAVPQFVPQMHCNGVFSQVQNLVQSSSDTCTRFCTRFFCTRFFKEHPKYIHNSCIVILNQENYYY